MTIRQIVDQAFRTQLFSRQMQGRLARLLSAEPEISQEDYRDLSRLRSALLGGSLRAAPRRQFRNVMEELVWEELESAGTESAELATHFHEVVAYALNRLPPLYATTEAGAGYQRRRAREELLHTIRQEVSEALEKARKQPDWHPERTPVDGRTSGRLLEQMGSLLQRYTAANDGKQDTPEPVFD